MYTKYNCYKYLYLCYKALLSIEIKLPSDSHTSRPSQQQTSYTRRDGKLLDFDTIQMIRVYLVRRFLELVPKRYYSNQSNGYYRKNK